MGAGSTPPVKGPVAGLGAVACSPPFPLPSELPQGLAPAMRAGWGKIANSLSCSFPTARLPTPRFRSTSITFPLHFQFSLSSLFRLYNSPFSSSHSTPFPSSILCHSQFIVVCSSTLLIFPLHSQLSLSTLPFICITFCFSVRLPLPTIPHLLIYCLPPCIVSLPLVHSSFIASQSSLINHHHHKMSLFHLYFHSRLCFLVSCSSLSRFLFWVVCRIVSCVKFD